MTPYIDHSLSKPPIEYLIKWLDNNVNLFGNENLLEINILDSSLKKSEIPNMNSKKYKEKTIFLFEISFLVEFILYDDSNLFWLVQLLNQKERTTSGKYISLKEIQKK